MRVTGAPPALSEAEAFYARALVAAHPGLIRPAQVRAVARAILSEGLPGRRAATARAGGRLVGAAFGVVRRGTLHVWGVYVAPDLLRRGIGGRLMGVLVAGADGAGAIEVRVLRRDVGAARFYRALGMAPAGAEVDASFPEARPVAEVMRGAADGVRRRAFGMRDESRQRSSFHGRVPGR